MLIISQYVIYKRDSFSLRFYDFRNNKDCFVQKKETIKIADKKKETIKINRQYIYIYINYYDYFIMTR